MVRHSSSVRSVADHSTTEDTTDGSDTECGCVWNGYPMCSRLQTLARPHFFVVGLILIGLIQSITETYFTETVLSSGFSVPFSITRWLILGSELAQLVIVIPIIYWGSTGRRPGWLAGLIIFLAVLSFIFGSEILTEQPAPVQSASYIFRFPYQDDPKLCQPTFGSLRLEKWNWYWLTVGVIPILHLAIGLSRLGYWAFGIAYIDDNASDNMSPLLIGVAVALKQFGPFIGSFISSVTVTKLFNGISWLIIGGVLLLAAAISAMFPKILLGSRLHRSGDPGLISSLKRILSNRVIIYYGVAAILVQTVVINIFSIEKTYIESVFYIPSDSLFYTIFSFQYLFGILKPTVAAVALLVSGIIIYRVKPRALILCLWSIISICITAAAIFALIFLKCSAYPIYGGASRNNLLEVCNMNCGCSQSLSFTPACTAQFPYVFYSPCHAGCTTVENADSTVYTNCACVPTGTVDVGHCNGGTCKIYWWLFQLFTLIATTSLASGFIGSLIICFRTILPVDKTVMVGIVFALSSFMARVPFKFLYDILTKWTCVYTVDSQCKFYDSDKLATFLNLFHICLLLAAAGLLSIACFMIQELQIYGNPPPPMSKNINQEPAAEMTDFRSQLNQTLKARRESAAEEQKLLSDSSTQTRKQGYENGNRASFAEDERQKSSTNISERKNTNIQKPLIPVKPPVLKEKINSTSTINSSTGSTPPASPAHSAGTTVQNQGYLTTLL